MSHAPISLDDETIAKLADALVARLKTPAEDSERLLTVADVAGLLGVNKSWVYEHAEDLGAIRLGSGARPRLRFKRDALNEAPDLSRAATLKPAKPRARQTAAAGVPLLDIGPRRPLRSRERKRPDGADTPPGLSNGR